MLTLCHQSHCLPSHFLQTLAGSHYFAGQTHVGAQCVLQACRVVVAVVQLNLEAASDLHCLHLPSHVLLNLAGECAHVDLAHVGVALPFANQPDLEVLQNGCLCAAP
jgi:hypothetical protein